MEKLSHPALSARLWCLVEKRNPDNATNKKISRVVRFIVGTLLTQRVSNALLPPTLSFNLPAVHVNVLLKPCC